MSAAEGVPLTRELLEALVEAAGMQSDMALPNVNLANVWYAVKQKCAAALASDAGTPEGERVEGWTGKPCPCPNCGAIRNERDAHFCSSTRAASAPLDESGAAPDAELDRLLLEYGHARERVGSWSRESSPRRTAELKRSMQIAVAIRAHVARVTREAHDIGFRRGLRELPPDLRRPPEDDELPRAVDMMAAMEAPAPAPGDASGETDLDFESWLDLYSNAWLNYGRDPVNATDGGYDYGHRSAMRSALLRLYRAATGEVVGQARIVGGKLGVDLIAERVPALLQGEIMQVDLVERRDKEGV